MFDLLKFVGVAARAVLVTSLSGPLGRFGIAGASAVALWADCSGVSLEVIDAYPSSASVMRPPRLAGPTWCSAFGRRSATGFATPKSGM